MNIIRVEIASAIFEREVFLAMRLGVGERLTPGSASRNPKPTIKTPSSVATTKGTVGSTVEEYPG